MTDKHEKAVEYLFNDVANSYDQLNDLFSLGLHRIWKRQLLIWLRPKPGQHWLDMCCGTGDMAIDLARMVRPQGSVLGIDSAENPLAIARSRASKEPWLSLSWQKGDALDSGLPSNHFDGAVMAYGLRNLSDPSEGLKELRRLLKPGAKAGVLDFNRAVSGSIGELFQKFYLRKFVVPLATRKGLREQYSYLEESLKRFPNGKLQEQIALEVGFTEASHRYMAAGQMGALFLKV